MMDVTLSILALIAGGVTLELFAGPRGSQGHQDERGFSLAADATELATELQAGNPS
jgi:hypothetical protein